MTVNDNTVSVWNSYINIADEKVDLDSVHVYKTSLSDYGIEDASDIETIEASFVIYKPETWEVIAEPGSFRISF